MISLVLDNQSQYPLKVFEMSTIQRIAQVSVPPLDSPPRCSAKAGIFGVEDGWKVSLQAASLYESPDPKQIIVLWFTAVPELKLSQAGEGYATTACAEVSFSRRIEIPSRTNSLLGRRIQ